MKLSIYQVPKAPEEEEKKILKEFAQILYHSSVGSWFRPKILDTLWSDSNSSGYSYKGCLFFIVHYKLKKT